MEKSAKKILRLRSLLITSIITTILFLPGCAGKKEVEELVFIMGVGIDIGKEEGTYLVTLQMAQPKMGGGSAAELENLTISVETSSLSLVTEKVNESLNKEPFSGTARVIILGEELARSGIDEAIDYFQRFYQYRRTAYLLVARGEAKEILETELRNTKLPSLSVLGTIEGQKQLSVFPVTRLGHYLTVLAREGQKPIIPLVEVVEPGYHGIHYKGEEGRELIVHRAGVFKEGKMIDMLTDLESKGYLWLDDSVKSRFIDSQGEDGVGLNAWVVEAKTKYKVEEIDGKMGIKFYIDARLAIREVLGQHKEMEFEEWHKFLKGFEPILAQAIQMECEAAIEKCRSTRLDFVGLGRKIEIKKPKYWREVKDNWQEEIVNFPVAYDIRVNIEHSGLVRNSPLSVNDN